MPLSDFDLEQLAQQIGARLSQPNRAPTIAAISQHVDGLGFPENEAERLKQLVVVKLASPGLRTHHIVVLVHGIRTNAEWQGLAVKELSPHCTRVVSVRYGFFDLISFWFPMTFVFRGVPVGRVHDELRALIADNPTAYISVVAHSFGTYIITRVLKENFDIRLFRLLMCGAIVPTDYDWRRMVNKPRGGLMNDIGLQDRLPIMAEISTWGYGPSGTYGFGTADVHDNFHECGHSGFFTADHLRMFWIPFLFKGENVESPANVTRKQPGYGWEFVRFLHLKYTVPIGVSVYFLGSILRYVGARLAQFLG